MKKKIYIYGELEWDADKQQYEIKNNEYIEYDGEVAFAKGDAPQPQQTTTVQKSEPWGAQIPYLQRGFSEAGRYLDTPKTYYEGNTVAPFASETEQALQLQTDRALAGSPVTGAANDQLQRTLQGDYLYGGEGFNQALNAATNRILPQINSNFARAGRYGSGLHQTAQTQALADAFAGQYGQERGNQMQAIGYAPQAAAADYNDFDRLASVGARREDLTQRQIGEDVSRYNYNRDIERQKLMDYMQLVSGNYGGTTTSTATGPTPPERNKLAGAIGGFSTGLGLGSSFGPVGSVIGGGLGALGGLL